jgi:hypothetical protein
MAKSIKSFSSLEGNFILPLSKYEFQLGENFNCSYNETISSVLNAMDENEIPKTLTKKYGIGGYQFDSDYIF